jgi:hypothetical protein
VATNRERNSDQDKVLLDNTYIESAIFGLFKIDISNYIKVKSLLAKEFHIQPSEIDAMPAWEYELFMREINQAVKEENERNKAEMDKAGYDKAQKMSDPRYAQKMTQNQMLKMPNMGSFKPPKF